jgi:DNA-directed RNA polymerase specialized sigma24 family protein
MPECVQIMDVVSELQSVSDTDPAIQIELEQRFEELGAGLLRYSPKAYATLLLHRGDGVSLQDIAKQFNISYAMVKRYLSKALTYCQQHLEETEKGSS